MSRFAKKYKSSPSQSNEKNVETSGKAREYPKLDELNIVRPVYLGFRQSDMRGSPPSFMSHRGQAVEQRRKALVRDLEKWAKKESTLGKSQAKEIKMPAIKIV